MFRVLKRAKGCFHISAVFAAVISDDRGACLVAVHDLEVMIIGSEIHSAHSAVVIVLISIIVLIVAIYNPGRCVVGSGSVILGPLPPALAAEIV